MAPSAPGHLDDARVAGEIVDHPRFSTERVLEKVRDLFREWRIDLEERRPVRCEHARKIRRRAPDELEAILSRGHGETWLERERSALADEVLEPVVSEIGQVRDDQVDWLRDRREQVALTQLDPVGDAVAKCVLPRDGEGIDADVRRDHVHGAFVRGDRDGDGARSGPDVGDRDRAAGDDLARGVHEGLRLRARDQHAVVDGEAKSVELFEAAQVGDGLTPRAPVDQVPIATLHSVRHLRVGMRVQHFLRDAEHVREEHVRIERGGRDPRRAKRRDRRIPLLAPGPHVCWRKYRRAVQREPTVADMVAARRVVDRYLPRAPLERSPLLSADLGADVYLKIETFKPTRTFKVRGALNKIASLDDAARHRGVVAASAGSHAQGVAFAAAALGAPATVVMPRGVSETIVRVCQAYGAEVLLEGEVYDDTLALAHRIEEEQGKTFVHPYADPLIVAGQGTIGLEILDDLPDVELVIVAVGGGGLIAGIALALRAARPAVRIVGVEPEGADAVGRSVRAGHPVVLEHPHSIADKLVAKSTEGLNVELATRYVDEFVTVSDRDLERASYEYLEALSLLVEPSGAAPLAAVRAGRVDPRGRRTVLVVSGGNATAELIARIAAQRDVAETRT